MGLLSVCSASLMLRGECKKFHRVGGTMYSVASPIMWKRNSSIWSHKFRLRGVWPFPLLFPYTDLLHYVNSSVFDSRVHFCTARWWLVVNAVRRKLLNCIVHVRGLA